MIDRLRFWMRRHWQSGLALGLYVLFSLFILLLLRQWPIPLAAITVLLMAPLIPFTFYAKRSLVRLGIALFALAMIGMAALMWDHPNVWISTAIAVAVVTAVVEYIAHNSFINRELVRHLNSASRLPEENPEPIYRLTADGRILYANAVGKRHLAEVDATASLCPAQWRTSLEAAVSARRVTTLDYEGKDGRRQYQARFVPTTRQRSSQGGHGANLGSGLTEQSEPHTVNVYVHDVTERVTAERSAREQRLLVRNVLDTTPNYIFVKDTEGTYLLCNEGFAQFFGVGINDVVGHKGYEFLPGAEQSDSYTEEDQVTLRTGAEIVNPPQLVDDAAGRPRWVQTIKRPILSADGRQYYILGVTTDVTELQTAADSLKRSNRLFRAVSEASSRLLSGANLDDELTAALATIGQAAEVDKVSIYQDDGEGNAILRYHWHCEESDSDYVRSTTDTERAAIPLTDALSSWRRQLVEGELVLTTTADVIAALPAAQEPRNVSALLLAPIFVAGELWGMISYEDRDTEREWSAAIAASVQTLAGSIGGAIGRRRAQEALRRQQTFTQSIIDNLPMILFVKDTELRYEMVNRRYGEIFGIEPEAAVGLSYHDVIGEDEYSAEAYSQDREVITQGEHIAVPEAPIFDSVGRRYWYQFLKRPIRDEQGMIRHMIGIGIDVSDRHEAEAALVEERNLLRTLINNIPDYIYIKDRDSRLVMANHAHIDLLGADSLDEVLGKTDFDFFPSQPTEATRKFYDLEQQIISSGTPVFGRVERGFHNRRGVAIWLLESKVPWLDINGNIQGIVGISRDISDIKRAEADLLEAKEAAEIATRIKSEFLANMSHEIRTPLNAMIGMTSLLLDSPLSSEQFEFVDTIRTSGETLLSILNDVLDFSKIEAGMLELEQQPFSLSQCIESTIELLARQANQKGIDLLYAIAPDVSHQVVGDVTRLRQVLVNLVSNGVKFTVQGEVIVEVTRARDELLRFTVRDTGIGIPPERIDRIFESFSQVDASTTRRFGGTGLGLAISRQLVEVMGGTIWVESAPGRGTAFHFTAHLPAAIPASAPDNRTSQPADAATIEPGGMKGKTALLIMQGGRARDMMVELFREWGLKVVIQDHHPSTGNEPESTEADQREVLSVDPDVILIDDDHGKRATGAPCPLAAWADEKPLPPIIRLVRLGAHNSEKDDEDATADVLLYKPVKRSLLLDAVNNAVNAEAVAAPTQPARPPSLMEQAKDLDRSMRILLAEDNLVNQKVAVRILERVGLNADVAFDGSEAVESVLRQHYDVILMDAHMPVMDGLEATRRIRSVVPAHRQPYIIAMTADAMEQFRQACLDVGMDDFVAKPVRINDLIVALQAADATIRNRRG